MLTTYDVQKKLMKEIESEKGFSLRKLFRIIELNALMNGLDD